MNRMHCVRHESNIPVHYYHNQNGTACGMTRKQSANKLMIPTAGFLFFFLFWFRHAMNIENI